jgi:O-antigen ligase
MAWLFIFPVASFFMLKAYYIAAAVSLYLVFVAGIPAYPNILHVVRNGWRVILLFIWLAFSALWSPDPAHTLWSVLIMSPGLMGFLIFAFLLTHYSPDEFCRPLLALLVILAIVNLILIATYGSVRVVERSLDDVRGSFCNGMVAISEACIPFVAYTFRGGRRKAYAVLFVAILVFNTLVSQSRGGVIVMSVAVLMLILAQAGKTRRFARSLVAMVLGIIVIGILLMNVAYTRTLALETMDRFIGMQPGWDLLDPNRMLYTIPDDAEVRTVQLKLGMEIIEDSPWGGIGYGSVQVYMADHFRAGYVAHNFLVEVATGVGLPGLAFFFYVIIGATLLLRKRYLYYKKTDSDQSYWYMVNIISLAIVLLHGMFRPLLQNPMLYIPLAAAYMAVIPRSSQAESDRLNLEA